MLCCHRIQRPKGEHSGHQKADIRCDPRQVHAMSSCRQITWGTHKFDQRSQVLSTLKRLFGVFRRLLDYLGSERTLGQYFSNHVQACGACRSDSGFRMEWERSMVYNECLRWYRLYCDYIRGMLTLVIQAFRHLSEYEQWWSYKGAWW